MARILLIDDTKNIRKMIKLTLTQAGHEVETAADGLEGLKAFGDGTDWDLTLVDQQMPGQQGNEVVIEARERDPMARIIMITAFATSELASQVLGAGAVDFLRKPFSTDVLRNAVELALSTPRQESKPKSAEEAAPLPEPGQPGFSIPSSSWRVNGFSFWPMPTPSTAPDRGFGRLFQVRNSAGHLSSCFVAITPHIREQMQRELQEEVAEDDRIWEKLCGQAVLSFIWEKAQVPPEMLPLYEMPKGTSNSSRGLVPWGPFGRG